MQNQSLDSLVFLFSSSEFSSLCLTSLSRSCGPWAGGREPLDLHLCLGMRCLVSAEECLAPPNGCRPQLAPAADICGWCTCGLFLLGLLRAWGPLPEDFFCCPSCSFWWRHLSAFTIPATCGPSCQPCRLILAFIPAGRGRSAASQMGIYTM